MIHVYRIIWKSNKDNVWRYASGEDLKPFQKLFPDAKNEIFEAGKPYAFVGSAGGSTAEKVARAMSDMPGVEKVLLREEQTALELDGTHLSEGGEREEETKEKT